MKETQKTRHPQLPSASPTLLCYPHPPVILRLPLCHPPSPLCHPPRKRGIQRETFQCFQSLDYPAAPRYGVRERRTTSNVVEPGNDRGGVVPHAPPLSSRPSSSASRDLRRLPRAFGLCARNDRRVSIGVNLTCLLQSATIPACCLRALVLKPLFSA